jgi:hypothetical protein
MPGAGGDKASERPCRHLPTLRGDQRRDTIDLARSNRCPGPTRRHRYRPDGFSATRRSIYAPIPRRMDCLRAHSHSGPSRDQAHDDRRGGALDTGNIVLILAVANLARTSLFPVMPRCSALISIKGSNGHADPAPGAAAMPQELTLFDVGPCVTSRQKNHACRTSGRRAPRGLQVALRQRYRRPHTVWHGERTMHRGTDSSPSPSTAQTAGSGRIVLNPGTLRTSSPA